MRRQRGFTLIELMVVVVVIAILAAIAVPNFLEQSRKGRRAEAVRALGDYQLAFERWRAENPSYAACSPTPCGSGSHPTASRPTSDFYTIGESGMDATGYTVTATRTSGGKMATDRCGNLSATNLTKPTWSGDSDCNN